LNGLKQNELAQKNLALLPRFIERGTYLHVHLQTFAESLLAEDSVEHANDTRTLAVANRVKDLFDLLCVLDGHLGQGGKSVELLGWGHADVSFFCSPFHIGFTPQLPE
jgi:hypothetical protein